jgi:hypothetical protein
MPHLFTKGVFMGEEEKPKNWWATLPGVITSLAAAITALGGLIVAVKQTGWLDKKTLPSEAQVSTAKSAPNADSKLPAHSPPTEKPAAAPQLGASVSRTVALPAVREATLKQLQSDGGSSTLTMLKAELSPKGGDNQILKIRVRVLSLDKYPMVFGGDLFRLVVDGAPRQPDDAPNEVLQPNAAKDADIAFVIPRGISAVALRFLYAEQIADMPLDLVPAR